MHERQENVVRVCHFVQHENHKFKWKTYLFVILWTSFRVGCCVEAAFRTVLKKLHAFRWPRSKLRVALQASSHPALANNVRFDSDSFAVGVDNHASRCMGNDKRLFENLVLARAAQRVGGISKGLAIEGKGTLVININDDNGKPHKIRIPNSLYLPGLRMCLLSPQHWAQEAGDNSPLPNGTRMENNAHNCKLLWGQGLFSKTIPFDDVTNTPIFYTSPSTSSYCAFVHTFQALEAPFFSREHVLQQPGRRWMDQAAPPDPAEFVAEENVNWGSATSSPEGDKHKHSPSTAPPMHTPGPVHCRNTLSYDPSPPLTEDDKYCVSAPNDQAELMRWHYRLGHESFARLKYLAINGEIPSRLARVRPPRCAGCLYGAMTKVPWRTKGQCDATHPVFRATKPGECVSVDHMQSTEPGFYGQAKGILTKTRYRNATIFVDHFSRLKFVYLMTSNLTSQETVEAKRAFERFAAEHGVRIAHYHCDNGRFADTLFRKACKNQNQKLTFCGVNAHFQNGIAERAIRDLSEGACKQLLHARQRWPQAVSTALWPYALRHAAHLSNVLPTGKEGKSKLELFSGIQVGSNMRFLHTFGCPVFALNNSLASNNSIPRWDPRACLGLNLGPSPTHARNVHMVLSLSTGLVSPQFHCRFNDFFETCKYGVSDGGLSSTWQRLAGFTRTSGEPVLHTRDGLLGTPNIAQATPQGTAEPNSFSISEGENVSSEFYEDGRVSFSDTDPAMPRQASQARRHSTIVTPQRSRVPTQSTCPRGTP